MRHDGTRISLEGRRTKSNKKNPGGVERHGLYKCGTCRAQFTVRMGTIFEESHLPLHKWLQAIHLLCSSKKGMSAHQMHGTLECTYRTARFLGHRIREAMRSGDFSPIGGNGNVVEADETFIGRLAGVEKSKASRATRTPSLRWSSAAASPVPSTSTARPLPGPSPS